MKIEQEEIKFQDFQLTPQQQGGILTLLSTKKSFQLNETHFSYLSALRVNPSIIGLVEFYLGQGWLVSFRELSHLIHFLIDQKIILNQSFYHYFNKENLATSRPHQEKKSSSLDKINPAQLPFLRSLEPALRDYLLEKSSIIEVPPQTRVTETGTLDRTLYILLQGQAAIYHVFGPQQRQRVAFLEAGGIFGEKGFLLNQPRSADVITTQVCRFLKIEHRPDLDHFIKSEAARSLQTRFWTIQALAASPYFKNLPSDCVDQLIFSGRVVKTKPQQVLFHEGQPGNTCYILIQGSVVISQKQKDINVLGQGHCFGEVSLMISGGRRTATVRTQQECLLVEINQNNFYKILGQNIVLARELEEIAYDRIRKDQQRAS